MIDTKAYTQEELDYFWNEWPEDMQAVYDEAEDEPEFITGCEPWCND